jgi:hypothetical protein
MKMLFPRVAALVLFVTAFSSWCEAKEKTSRRFQVTLQPGLVSAPQTGRLLVVLSRKDKSEPRLSVGGSGQDAPIVIGRDADDFSPGKIITLDEGALTCPISSPSELAAGDYYVQALLESNADLRSPDAPGNLYSPVQKLSLDPAHGNTVQLELSKQIAAEQLPVDTDLVKFVKIQSKLLSAFHGRPIYLRAGIILPRDYAGEPARKYPLWVRIGGLDSRYSTVLSLMDEKSDFKKTWLADDTSRMILLHLDGAGPYGDCYQVNSANNGPYGDAITQELIPYVEQNFRGIGKQKSRVLSGLSTGGWASLALQVFYPDFFNGTWTFCPDGVDFRAFELVNIYEDDNAYVNKYGFERPSDRALNGDTRLTMRREVQLENVLGRGNNWTMSGGQWCAWNATYGPRGKDGRPIPLWNPQTGKIDPEVAAQWKKYDLRLIMQENWKTLGPKLQGKLHISVGEADNYFLNNGVHYLDEFLSKADPPYQGRIVYGPGKGHGWVDIPLRKMMDEMKAATAAEK